MLKKVIDKETWELLPESFQAEYEPGEDGSYALKGVEGFISENDHKAKVGEFRNTNIEVMKERDALKKSQMTAEQREEYEALKKAAADAEKDSLKKADKFEDWKAKWRQESEGQIAEKDKAINELRSELTEIKLYDKTVRTAARAAGVIADDLDDVVSLVKARGNFQLDGDNIKVFDDDGDPFPGDPSDFFSKYFKERRPKFYEGTGSGGSGAIQDDQRSKDAGGSKVIAADDQAAFNQNLEKIASGEVTRATN